GELDGLTLAFVGDGNNVERKSLTRNEILEILKRPIANTEKSIISYRLTKSAQLGRNMG
ncbi:unnamed protein product, partial [marine sediment metagenome]